MSQPRLIPATKYLLIGLTSPGRRRIIAYNNERRSIFVSMLRLKKKQGGEENTDWRLTLVGLAKHNTKTQGLDAEASSITAHRKNAI
jgi:hypothetical protein